MSDEPKRQYVVTDEYGDYRQTYGTRVGVGPYALCGEDAAKMWAEAVHNQKDNPEEMVAFVTDPDGAQWRVEITVRYEPVFYPGKVKQVSA